jgi:hypothetical protein
LYVPEEEFERILSGVIERDRHLLEAIGKL